MGSFDCAQGNHESCRAGRRMRRLQQQTKQHGQQKSDRACPNASKQKLVVNQDARSSDAWNMVTEANPVAKPIACPTVVL